MYGRKCGRGEPLAEGTDKRGRLAEEPFAYRATKDGQVFISWQGRSIPTLKGPNARRFLARIADLDEAGVQLALAKANGSFKHGNERRDPACARSLAQATSRLPLVTIGDDYTRLQRIA